MSGPRPRQGAEHGGRRGAAQADQRRDQGDLHQSAPRPDTPAARSATPVRGHDARKGGGPAGRATALARAADLAGEWASAAGRILLALVLGWFGYHELVGPGLWTGYVPVVAPSSSAAILAVLAHGWVLLVLAVALAVGIAPRLAALAAAALLLEIVVSLAATAGLSDLTLRDVGVLGLAVTLTGIRQQRLVLRR